MRAHGCSNQLGDAAVIRDAVLASFLVFRGADKKWQNWT